MKSFVVALAVLVGGAVAKPGGYTGDCCVLLFDIIVVFVVLINKPCDEVLGAAQCKRLETSFTSTNVKLRKRLRYDLLLTVT